MGAHTEGQQEQMSEVTDHRNREACLSEAARLQDELLEGVSRTFALTIPELPDVLRRVVSNAYLLCRIVDTIEDEPALAPKQKRELTEAFARVVIGHHDAESFATHLAPLLSEATIPAERSLVRQTSAVIEVTHGLQAPMREPIQRCISVMADGMAHFQEQRGVWGLRDLLEMNRYCYVVAGVVGEMLTEHFCAYSSAIAAKRGELMRLSVSFGQGLQMTNILKDIWEDRRRGACWLPRDLFASTGFDLKSLTPGCYEKSFGKALQQLIGIAHGHLHNALIYTLLIPREETGIRNFCLWAIGMAQLTLRKIYRHRDFRSGERVKITRGSVAMTVAVSRACVRSDRLIRTLFRLGGLGLPLSAQHLDRP